MLLIMFVFCLVWLCGAVAAAIWLPYPVIIVPSEMTVGGILLAVFFAILLMDDDRYP